MSDVVGFDSSISFHLSKLSNAKFSILYDISLVRDWKRKVWLITPGSEKGSPHKFLFWACYSLCSVVLYVWDCQEHCTQEGCVRGECGKEDGRIGGARVVYLLWFLFCFCSHCPCCCCNQSHFNIYGTASIFCILLNVGTVVHDPTNLA